MAWLDGGFRFLPPATGDAAGCWPDSSVPGTGQLKVGMDTGRAAFSVLLGLVLVHTVAAQPATHPRHDAMETRFAAGQDAMRAGRFASAEEEFRAVLGLRPELTEARANLGLVLFLQGAYGESVAELERVAATNHQFPATHLFLGLGHLKLGKPAEAIPWLQRSLEENPANLEGRSALAACYLAQGDYAGAVREHQAAFAHDPNKTEAWYRLGREYLNLMSDLAGRLVFNRPDSVWTLRLGADMLVLSRAWAAAVPYYETALKRGPDVPGLHASLGTAYLHLGDGEAAERHFLVELNANPRSEASRLGLAEISLRTGDPDSALAQLQRVWDASPRWLVKGVAFPVRRMPAQTALALVGKLPEESGAAVRFLRAELLDDAGEAAKAASLRSLLTRQAESIPLAEPGSLAPAELCQAHRYLDCVRALESRLSLARSQLLMMGRAYFELGQVERAIVALTHAMRGSKDLMPEAVYWTVRSLQSMADQCFRRVEALAPGSWRVHQMRAESHRQRHADDEAVAEYRKAIELKPDEPELHRSLGLLHLLDNSLDEAQTSLERALELNAADPRTLYVMGRLLIAKQQHEESIRFLEGALRLDPNLIEARPSLGRAYLRAGRFEEAAIELEKGLALDHFGDVHYSLFQAHRQLGNLEAARAALERSTEMRRSSFARDRSKFDRWIKSE